jgi:hypothetical protein
MADAWNNSQHSPPAPYSLPVSTASRGRMSRKSPFDRAW